jgi:Kelch motif/Galactose oxidase, central domain
MIPTIEGKPPRGRQFHTCCSISNNRIVTFGGSDDFRCFNDLHCLRCDQKAQNWEWIQPEVKGNIPAPRTGHSAVVIAERYIIITGGYNPFSGSEASDDNSSTHYFEDTYILDTLNWVWKELVTEPSSLRRQCLRSAGVQQEPEDTADELDGLVWSSAMLIDGNYLPTDGNKNNSSSSSNIDSTNSTGVPELSSTESILFYGGLTAKGQKSRNVTFRVIDIASLDITNDNSSIDPVVSTDAEGM